LVRNVRVIFDDDLAELYGVLTGALNRAVKRNAERFPDDFMFQLTPEAHDVLKCQIGISRDWGGLRYAFSEQGVANQTASPKDFDSTAQQSPTQGFTLNGRRPKPANTRSAFYT
jgi:hypothetical protein